MVFFQCYHVVSNRRYLLVSKWMFTDTRVRRSVTNDSFGRRVERKRFVVRAGRGIALDDDEFVHGTRRRYGRNHTDKYASRPSDFREANRVYRADSGILKSVIGLSSKTRGQISYQTFRQGFCEPTFPAGNVNRGIGIKYWNPEHRTIAGTRTCERVFGI